MRTRGASSTHCGSPTTARKVSGEFARASLMECRNSTTKLRISSDDPPMAPYHTSKDAQGGLVTSTLRSNVSNSPILLRAMRSNAAIQMRAILGASFTTTKRGGRAAYRADRRELRSRARRKGQNTCDRRYREITWDTAPAKPSCLNTIARSDARTRVMFLWCNAYNRETVRAGAAAGSRPNSRQSDRGARLG